MFEEKELWEQFSTNLYFCHLWKQLQKSPKVDKKDDPVRISFYSNRVAK